MLSHLKSRETGIVDQESSSVVEIPTATDPSSSMAFKFEEKDETRETCDVLCSLGASPYAPDTSASVYMDDGTDSSYGERQGHGKGKGCSKQHQLPMFLSSKLLLLLQLPVL